MASRFRSSPLPRPLMDRVQMAIAVAREQVLDEHVRSAAELVEEGQDRAPVARLIAAYARLHHLSNPVAQRVDAGVLAMLGRAPEGPSGPLHGPRSWLGRLRYRLRGRVNPELRAWVERHTARVELTLVEIHRENALSLTRLVEGKRTVGEVVALYADLLELRPAVAEMVRLQVLDTLHDHPSRRAGASPDRGPIPLRAAENDR